MRIDAQVVNIAYSFRCMYTHNVFRQKPKGMILLESVSEGVHHVKSTLNRCKKGIFCIFIFLFLANRERRYWRESFQGGFIVVVQGYTFLLSGSTFSYGSSIDAKRPLWPWVFFKIQPLFRLRRVLTK